MWSLRWEFSQTPNSYTPQTNQPLGLPSFLTRMWTHPESTLPSAPEPLENSPLFWFNKHLTVHLVGKIPNSSYHYVTNIASKQCLPMLVFPKLTGTKAVRPLKTVGILTGFQSHLLRLPLPENPLSTETSPHYYRKTHGMLMTYNPNINRTYNPKIQLLIWMWENNNKIINRNR